ncbi:MAG: hypothetical protein LBR44_04835 [Clostridiales Family XIII bacterium]|jgi:hypothetical protein|nr:hypothetical protein [Clostridiales Family XIII bacterium]
MVEYDANGNPIDPAQGVAQGTPPPQYYQPAPGKPLHVVSLVLGIISIVVCWLFGLPSIVLGIIAVILARNSKQTYNSVPGFVTGLIGLILGVIVLFAWLVLGAALSML